MNWDSVRSDLHVLPTTELLHRYNAAKDLAHSLMDLIAQRQQCTIADVYTLLDVAASEVQKQELPIVPLLREKSVNSKMQ